MILELKDPKILGEKHPTYGYSVWSETDGEYPVMFNVKDEKKLMPGVRITYDSSEEKTSAKGKDYLRLKGVKFEDAPGQAKPFEKKQAPTFEIANKAQTDKDTQITKNMVWKNLLQVYDLPTMTIDSPQWEMFWANVELHTMMLTVGSIDSLKPQSSAQSSVPSLGDTFRAKKAQVTNEFDESDMPYEEEV